MNWNAAMIRALPCPSRPSPKPGNRRPQIPKPMNKLCSRLLVTIGAFVAGSYAFASLQTINNDAWWKDQNGNPLYAQGGGISNFGGTYYMYGVEYGGAHTYYSTGTVNSDTSFQHITCYSSTDLAHWTWRSEAAGPTQLPGASWVGRLGAVCYNSSTGKYVMWCEYDGTDGSGMACLTSSSPTGTFNLVRVQTSIANVYYNIPGDDTVFCDQLNNNTPYLIFSDPHGRQHAYVSTFSSDQTVINPATLIATWPQGQEADCMFSEGSPEYYHFCTSQLHGWSYSHAYEVRSTNITGGYSSDADFSGTDGTSTYYSQISYFVHNFGSSQHTIICVGDRWADFSSNYKNAGHGNNYLIMCPVTLSNHVPTFVARSSWQFDNSTGDWQ
jgi:hypothetical protein